ncbi:MAG: hypothetical protein ACYSWR_02900 [Planctomycetota bacterium]|jgi:hypothetical protein
MKQATEWKIATVVIICLVAFTSFAQAQEADESGKKLKGEVRLRYDWFGVNKDRGRFREDHWRTDKSTGGLDWLRLETTGPDKYGHEWLIEGRALHDYDYRMSILAKKLDSHYLKIDFSGLRRYYDGSNERWYSSLKRLEEMSDFDYFVDRRNYNIEFGLTPPEGAHWVFGWHRLEKDGREVLLHGRKADDDNDFYGIPTVLDVRGITDTIYGEVSRTFAEKYNFRIRQEFEQYRSDRYQDWQAMDSAGVVDIGDGDISDDHLGYTNWRTMFMFDSFLDEETYVTANYMYNYLNSNSSYNCPVPVDDSHYYKTLSGGISRRTNVGGLGYRRANILQIPSLDLSAGVRIEDSLTSGGSLLQARNNALLTTESRLDEVRVAEVLRLVYKGFKRTTLSFDADLEQRDLDWYGNYGTSVSNNLDRKSDTDFTDQIYTFKAVHRFNRAVKSTVKFRIKDLERSLTNRYLGRTTDRYPGWLGDYRRTGNDLTLKTDFRINNKTSTTLLYQLVQESIDFDLGKKTSNQEIHRGAGSLSFIPAQNLFLVGTFMLENYDLDTAAVGTGSQALGARPYDFRGNSYSFLLDGTYAFNDRTSATLGLRHTAAQGTVDYAGDYAYDSVGLTLNRKMSKNQVVSVGYQFISFDNHGGDSFDDYSAHGAFATYTYKF